MAEYMHGAYGQIGSANTKATTRSRNAIVYVGTAPVHTVEGGAKNVNRPIVVNDMSEARKYFGMSYEWENYTLCEAVHAHFALNEVGPLILINVLDPATHKSSESGTVSLTPENGMVRIVNAGDIMLESVTVESKVKDTDYKITYDPAKGVITLAEARVGGLGTEALTITYESVDVSKVTENDVIGASDGDGLNTGLFAVKNVYQLTGYVPSFLLCPGYSGLKDVHAAMIKNSQKINGHWDAYVLADIPIADAEGEAVTLSTAKTWKDANGYNCANETVYFPLAKGTDGYTYHLSVLAAANLQVLLSQQDGIPYKTASNTGCPIIENLYLGEDSLGRVYDDELINEKLCKNGIASAAYVGGSWRIWGAHSANYVYGTEDRLSEAETNRMMLQYISNDFQHRRSGDVDKPMTANDIKMLVSEEQSRLDALVKTGALIYGKVVFNGDAKLMGDIITGKYLFSFEVSTTPLCRSLIADVSWTDEGYQVYFASIAQ